MVGLGRMGANMAHRVARGGVRVIGVDPDSAAAAAFAAEPGCTAADSIEAMVHALPAPRLAAEDIIVDGGNAYYKDSVRRAVELASYGIRFVDCGVSGGVWGLENGYALMFGGSPAAARAIEPIIQQLAPS